MPVIDTAIPQVSDAASEAPAEDPSHTPQQRPSKQTGGADSPPVLPATVATSGAGGTFAQNPFAESVTIAGDHEEEETAGIEEVAL